MVAALLQTIFVELFSRIINRVHQMALFKAGNGVETYPQNVFYCTQTTLFLTKTILLNILYHQAKISYTRFSNLKFVSIVYVRVS